jgi:hypothetical protein
MKIIDRYMTKLRTHRDAVNNELGMILCVAKPTLYNTLNGMEPTEPMALAMERLISQLDYKVEKLVEKYAKLTAMIVLVDRFTGNLWKR